MYTYAQVTASTDIISIKAGISSGQGSSGDVNTATRALLNRSSDVSINAEGDVYIADRQHNKIRKVYTTHAFD